MSNVVKSAFILFIATMISKVLGFLRDLVIACVWIGDSI
jgi:putative peptidoglycan lipid II flippase